MAKRPINLFYCYAHEDSDLLEELKKQLTLLRRRTSMADWDDKKILAGELYALEIEEHFKKADIILFLVSSDFIASDFCGSTEMDQAIRRHRRGEARVIPVILRSCTWETAPFGGIKPLPGNEKPVTSWENRDEALEDVANGIHQAMTEHRGSDTKPPTLLTRRKLIQIGTGLVVTILVAVGLTRPFPTPTPRTGKPTGNGASFAVFPSYDPSGYVGDIGDLSVTEETGLVHFVYTTNGKGPHEWEWKYLDDGTLNPNPCGFAGVLCLNPPNDWGRKDPHGGFDLRGRKTLTWKARSLSGPVSVKFVIGGVVWQWDGQTHMQVAVPYPDSMPWTPLGIQKLTSTWQTFIYNLSAVPQEYLRAVVAGFGWEISWNNALQGTGSEQPQTFIIEIQDISYER
jgi:hypothetical protein